MSTIKTVRSSLIAHVPPHLEAHEVECVRGERRLFKNLMLHVEPGACLLVQGANGSGKTSLLRILAGLTPPANGHVHWKGQPIKLLGEAYRNDLLYCGHNNALKDELSAEENLLAAAALSGRAATADAAREALSQAGLAGRERLPVRALSQGQRRRASLARLLLYYRPVWILDEPFTALDTHAMHWLSALIDRHLALGGLTVLTSHQDISLASGVRTLRLGS